jgi:hypothetical protein
MKVNLNERMVELVDNQPIYRDEDRSRSVGYIFEQLARHCLRLPALSWNEWESERGRHPHFDIDDERLNAYFDVKGANNHNQLKLFSDQLTAQLEGLELPADVAFLWIFSYRGCKREHGKVVRTLKHASGESLEELSTFLARNVLDVYLVSLRLADLIRKKNGTHPYVRDMFRDRCTLCVNRTELKEISRDARNALERFGVMDVPRWLPPRANRLRTRIVETVFDGNPISFRLYLLVPNGFKNRFLRRLNGTVKRIEDL